MANKISETITENLFREFYSSKEFIEKSAIPKKYGFLSKNNTPNTRTQEHKNTRTQEHKNTRTQEHKNTRTQEHKNTRTQEHKNTRTQEHKNTRTQEQAFLIFLNMSKQMDLIFISS